MHLSISKINDTHLKNSRPDLFKLRQKSKIIVNSVGVEARGGAKNAEGGGETRFAPPPSCATAGHSLKVTNLL